MVHAVYPGSFDPITNGHLDIIKRASKIFDRLTVAVVANPQKTPLFTVEERMEMIRISIQNINAPIEVDQFDGLLVEYASKIQADAILRGLRAVSDFEFEFQLSSMNRWLNPDIQTIYLMSGAEVTYLSSGLIKEISSLGADVSGLVPPIVLRYLKSR